MMHLYSRQNDLFHFRKLDVGPALMSNKNNANVVWLIGPNRERFPVLDLIGFIKFLQNYNKKWIQPHGAVTTDEQPAQIGNEVCRLL